MRYLLAKSNRAVLGSLDSNQTLCAFDFDGTLAPIVNDPAAAALRPSTRALLAQLAHFRPCAVISGRSRVDLLSKLRGIPLVGVLGNHGDEDGSAARPVELNQVQEWKARLEGALVGLQGVWVEDKELSLAIHYRSAPAQELARKLAWDAAAALPGARVFGGKAVINVAPRSASHKGDALMAILGLLEYEQAIYVGDDENDEEAFATKDTVSIRIGRSPSSAARFYLRGQDEIDRLLDLLLEGKLP